MPSTLMIFADERILSPPISQSYWVRKRKKTCGSLTHNNQYIVSYTKYEVEGKCFYSLLGIKHSNKMFFILPEDIAYTAWLFSACIGHVGYCR